MGTKKLILVLHAHQEYIKHIGEDAQKYAAESNYLFEAISNTYIPLIQMLENLEKDGISFCISLVLSPVLCTLLEDAQVQQQYIDWLDARIEFGKTEIDRTSGNPELQNAAKACLEKAESDRNLFELYKRRLVKKFHEYKKKGFVELLATCGTDIFLPYYNDMEEILNAQVESGIYAFRSFFGCKPDGFWLPELGYYNGIEKSLRAYGLSYTILDTRSFLFGETEPKNGIFTPARFTNALVAFSRDAESDDEIFGEDGFALSAAYRNEARDVGFILPPEKLQPLVPAGTSRYSLGYKYWNKSAVEEDEVGNALDSEHVYDAQAASALCGKQAKLFVRGKAERLEKASSLVENGDVSLVVTLDLNRLRAVWNEGIAWLEQVIRAAGGEGLELATPRMMFENPFTLQRIKPYFGASCGEGYGENLLSSRNSWMMRYVRKASERMVDLSERFPTETGLKARLLNMGAKELMFAQSVGWAEMIDSGEAADYAEKRFTESINDFTAVFDALGSNTVSTEWLTTLESRHSIFPWMNYRIFSRKH